MTAKTKNINVTTLFLTAVVLAAWQIMGGDYYTKFEVVEQVETELDPDDPLVAAGFYESNIITKTVPRDSFRLGLLPTPSSMIDKHMLSVISLLGPLWFVTLVLFWRSRRRLNRAGS